MSSLDPAALLALLRDPSRETGEIAAAAGAPRDETARACRLAHGLAKAKPEEILSLPQPLALALLDGAAGLKRADVAAAAAAHADREVAKAGKRLLYRMKMQGLEVPEPPRAPPPAPPPPPPEPALPCYASAPDGAGERALFVARAVPGRGVEVAQAIVSDVKGLVELQLGTLGRKEYRQLGEDLLHKGGDHGLSEVPRAEALADVVAAAERSRAQGLELPRGAGAWLKAVGPVPPPADVAGRLPPLPGAEEHEAEAASGALHDLPVFRGWYPEREALVVLGQKLDAIEVSPLYLDEAQRAGAMRDAVDAAVDAYFDEGRRRLFAARLFTTAIHLERLGDPVAARRAAAAGRALAGGADARSQPFASRLFHKAFDLGSSRPRSDRSPVILPVTP